jgi:hypothetical protein
VHDPDDLVFVGQLVEHNRSGVHAAVVDDDDLEQGVLLGQQGVDGLADVVALVVSGHDDGDAWVLGQIRRFAHVSGSRTFPVKVVGEATDHPHVGHEQGVDEREVLQNMEGECVVHTPAYSISAA